MFVCQKYFSDIWNAFRICYCFALYISSQCAHHHHRITHPHTKPTSINFICNIFINFLCVVGFLLGDYVGYHMFNLELSLSQGAAYILFNWKQISSFHTFLYSKGQLGITSLRIAQFQNVNHQYKWENVFFNNIPRTQFWPCAQKSLILTEWVTNTVNSRETYWVSIRVLTFEK